MTNTVNFSKGQRVTVRHMSGTEHGTVTFITPDGMQVHCHMDDNTYCWFPPAQVSDERLARKLALARISLGYGEADDFALVLGDDATAEDIEAIDSLRR